MAEKMEKVWNITDHPNTKVREQALVIFGQTVLPGSYVKVPASRLKNAHKLKKEIAAQMAHVGAEPPADYAGAKTPVALTLPKTHARARFTPKTGAAKVTPAAPDMNKTADALKKPDAPAPKAEAQPTSVAPAEASAETAKEPKGRNGGHRR